MGPRQKRQKRKFEIYNPMETQEPLSELRNVLLENIGLLNERMSTLHDLFRRNYALNDFSDLSPEKQEELVVALQNVRELKWIAYLLPALEMQLSWNGILRAWLEHALLFQNGATEREILEDPNSEWRISATAYLWRMIWPLLAKMISDQGFNLDSIYMMTATSKSTPERVKRLLDAYLGD